MRRDTKIECSEYLQFIREQPCTVCSKPPPSDPDHIIARGMGSSKRNDFTCIPLCREHHSERGQIDNEKFQLKYNINLWHEAAVYLIEFFVPVAVSRGICIKKGKDI